MNAHPSQAEAAQPARPLRIFVSSGEVSGDIGGAHLIRQMRREHPDVRFFGIGGPRIREAGAEVDVMTNHLGTVGITEVIRQFVPLLRLAWRTRKRILADKPDAAILIANDLFNAALGRWLRWQGIATVAYFPPQVWIWRAIVGFLGRGFDVVLTPFPAEYDAYARALPDRRSVLVSHYLVETLVPVSNSERAAARQRLGIPEDERCVALLAGSRFHEVQRLAPVLLAAALLLRDQDPGVRFAIPVADESLRPIVEKAVAKEGLRDAVVLADDSHEVMRAADMALLSSGTSTLEAALLGVPMVVVYRLSASTYGFIQLCYRLGLLARGPASLPSLLVGREVVPEFLQGRATSTAVAREAGDILASPERQRSMKADLEAVRACVSTPDGLGRATAEVYRLAKSSRLASLAARESRQASERDRVAW